MSGFMKNVQWFSFRNDSGEEIPPHAIITADDGFNDEDGKIWISAIQPNASGISYLNYVNGPLAVPNGKTGLCTNSQIVAVAFDDADPPVAGDSLGPVSGEWLGFKGATGFKVISLSHSSQEKQLAWCVRRESCPKQNAIIVITLFGPPTGGTWSLNGWEINGSTDSVSTLAYNISAATLQSDLEGHSGVGSGNVSVIGGPGNSANFIVEFVGSLAGEPVATPVVTFGSLTGPGAVGGIAYPVQIGRP